MDAPAFEGQSLADLLTWRAALRRREPALRGALEDVQRELLDWEQDPAVRDRSAADAAPELLRLWHELAERERQLVLELLHVRQLRERVSHQIDRRMHRPHADAG